MCQTKATDPLVLSFTVAPDNPAHQLAGPGPPEACPYGGQHAFGRSNCYNTLCCGVPATCNTGTARPAAHSLAPARRCDLPAAHAVLAGAPDAPVLVWRQPARDLCQPDGPGLLRKPYQPVAGCAAAASTGTVGHGGETAQGAGGRDLAVVLDTAPRTVPGGVCHGPLERPYTLRAPPSSKPAGGLVGALWVRFKPRARLARSLKSPQGAQGFPHCWPEIWLEARRQTRTLEKSRSCPPEPFSTKVKQCLNTQGIRSGWFMYYGIGHSLPESASGYELRLSVPPS